MITVSGLIPPLDETEIYRRRAHVEQLAASLAKATVTLAELGEVMRATGLPEIEDVP
jgi:hypothetical protein